MATILMGKCLLEVVPMMNIMTGSVKSIYGFTDSLIRPKQKKDKITDNDVIEFIDTQDIKNKLTTYKLLLSEFPHTTSKSINISLEGVKNIVIDIERKIDMIENKVNYNKKLWTRTYAYPIIDDYKKLQILVKKLDERITALKTVTELSKMVNDGVFNGQNICCIKDLDANANDDANSTDSNNYINYGELDNKEYLECISDITHEIKHK